MDEADPKAKRPQPVSRINWSGLQQAMDAEGLEAVVAASPENLSPGMVLNIEPAVLDAQGFLYHLEDLFVVTEAGPRILTRLMDTTDLLVIR